MRHNIDTDTQATRPTLHLIPGGPSVPWRGHADGRVGHAFRSAAGALGWGIANAGDTVATLAHRLGHRLDAGISTGDDDEVAEP